jgi:hypothetical protein
VFLLKSRKHEIYLSLARCISRERERPKFAMLRFSLVGVPDTELHVEHCGDGGMEVELFPTNENLY